MNKTEGSESVVVESHNGILESPDKKWVFTCDDSLVPMVSSGTKNVYSGEMCFPELQKTRRACAVVFKGSPERFGTECANLAAMTAIGVGPALIAIGMTNICGSFMRPTIFEEHAGVGLAELIESRGHDLEKEQVILHRSGTAERVIENKKILYDVRSQVINAHRNGLYHIDLRCANVCVRRFGADPGDIKATIIDFELGSDSGGEGLGKKASLYRLLFETIPTFLAGENVNVAPSPLEFDMGYLAALQYQLSRDELSLEHEPVSIEVIEDFVAFLNDDIDYFRYQTSYAKRPFARSLSSAHDLASYAEDLGLLAVVGDNFANSEVLNEARSLHREYLDKEDLADLSESAPAKLGELAEELVRLKFETYKATRREQGKPVEYETVEDQPLTLQMSNYAQLAHIPVKVRALGYDIITRGDWEASLADGSAAELWERVEGFEPDQVEYLAELEHERWCEERKADGWEPGERSAENKTSPYLDKTYNELDEDVKEYDRKAVYVVIPFLERAGMVVVRRR